jgi:tetratricopeptide (TPR) repeat protein
MKTKPYTKRYCLVSVNLTMTDIDTAKTIHTFTITKEFDSEKDGEKSAVGQFLGFSSDSPPPVDQTVNGMVDLVVQEFCQQISPHRQALSVKLEGGKTKAVEKGNTLAKAKDYPGALEMYEAGLAEKPDDDGAAFNAGVMYEAQGDFANAEKSYQKAFKLGDNKQKYADAKQRVRQEGNGSK